MNRLLQQVLPADLATQVLHYLYSIEEFCSAFLKIVDGRHLARLSRSEIMTTGNHCAVHHLPILHHLFHSTPRTFIFFQMGKERGFLCWWLQQHTIAFKEAGDVVTFGRVTIEFCDGWYPRHNTRTSCVAWRESEKHRIWHRESFMVLPPAKPV